MKGMTSHRSSRGVSLLNLMLATLISGAISVVFLRYVRAEMRESNWNENVTLAIAISRALDSANRRVTASAIDPTSSVYTYTYADTNPADIGALRGILEVGNELAAGPRDPGRHLFLWGATGNRVFWHVPQAFLQTRPQFFQGVGVDVGAGVVVEACGLFPDLDGNGAVDPWTGGEAQCRVAVTETTIRGAADARSARMMSTKHGLYGECVKASPCTPLPLTTP